MRNSIKVNSHFWNQLGGTLFLTLFCLFTISSTIEAQESVETTVDAITDVMDEFVGQTVTITGEIEEIVSPNSLKLKEDDGLLDIFNNNDVLVVGVDIEANDLAEGQKIQVTGEVREFFRSEWEENYYLTSDLDLIEVLAIEHENEPIVRADSLQVLR